MTKQLQTRLNLPISLIVLPTDVHELDLSLPDQDSLRRTKHPLGPTSTMPVMGLKVTKARLSFYIAD